MLRCLFVSASVSCVRVSVYIIHSACVVHDDACSYSICVYIYNYIHKCVCVCSCVPYSIMKRQKAPVTNYQGLPVTHFR